MKWTLVILLIFIAFPMSAVYSESENPIWFFAYSAERKELIAFNESGTSNILLTGIDITFSRPSSRLSGVRLDSEHILVSLDSEPYQGLYRLSHDDAQLVDGSDNPAFRPVALQEGAAVLAHGIQGDEFIPRVTLFTTEIQRELSSRIFRPEPNNFFSDDGQTFWYLGYNGEEEWNVIAHDVASGNERVIYDFGTSTYPQITPLVRGESWLIRTIADQQANYQQLMADGQLIPLGSFADNVSATNRETGNSIYALDGSLIIYPTECPDVCMIEVREGNHTRFLRGDPSFFGALPIVITPTGNLVIMTSEDMYYLLTPDRRPQWLKYYISSFYSFLFSNPYLSTSPDGHWLVTSDSETRSPVQLRNLLTGDVVAEYERLSASNSEGLAQVIYHHAGIISLRNATPELQWEILTYSNDSTNYRFQRVDEWGYPAVVLADGRVVMDAEDDVRLYDLYNGNNAILLEGEWSVVTENSLDIR
jgi:hypothetical protein